MQVHYQIIEITLKIEYRLTPLAMNILNCKLYLFHKLLLTGKNLVSEWNFSRDNFG